MSDPNTAGVVVAAPGAAGSAAPNAAAGNMVPLTALQEEREKRQALASEVEAMKAQMATLTAGAANGNGNGNGNVNVIQNDPNLDYVRQLDSLWRDDPRKAMQAELMIAINWQDQVNAEVDEQVESLSTKNKDFGVYSAEVRRHLRRLPLEQRSRPGVAEAAFYMVKGRQTDTLVKTEAERLAKVAAAASAAGVTVFGGSSGGGSPAVGVLSEPERAAAAALGISEAEYLKYRK